MKSAAMITMLSIIACTPALTVTKVPTVTPNPPADAGHLVPEVDGGDFQLDGGESDEDTGVIVIDCGNKTQCGSICADLDTDPDNCGLCGRSCVIPRATSACSSGECSILNCEPGYYDQDQDINNGCEFEDMCVPDQVCSTSCQSDGVTTCAQGAMSCTPPAESCNASDDDCDGKCDNGPLAGCRHGIHRGYGLGHVFSDDINTVENDPYQVEARNYFYLYAASVPETRPLFLCRKGNGKRFLTTRTDCDMLGARERQIGFISPNELCDSIPLYRVHHAPTDNHFYTKSASERDNAINNLGYTDLGVLGHVWEAAD